MIATLRLHAALVLAGSAALIAESCWLRRCGDIIGADGPALAAVLAVHLACMAGGAWLGGRLARGCERPARLLIACELLAATWILLSPFILLACEGLVPLVGGGLWIRALLAALVVGPGAAAAAAVLPCAWCLLAGSAGSRAGRASAALSVGGASGALLAGYWGIGLLGIHSCLVGAAGLDLAAAGLVSGLPRAAAPARDRPAPVEGRLPSWLLVLGVMVSGWTLLAGEVLIARFQSLVEPVVPRATAILLAGTLLGWAAGAAGGARLARGGAGRCPLALGLALQGLLLALVPAVPAPWWQALADQGTWALLPLPLLTALAGGLVFPLAVGLVRTADARTVGRLSAWATLAGLPGALCTGALLIPALGLVGAMLVSALPGCLMAALLLGWGPLRWPVLAAVLVPLLVCLLPWSLQRSSWVQTFLAGPGDAVLAVVEGRAANLTVLRRDGTATLEIDRLWQGHARRNHQAAAAHIPALLHGAPRRVLVIGLGVGQTLAAFCAHPTVSHLTAVDLEAELPGLLRSHFPAPWQDDPRVSLVVDDGRRHLALAGPAQDLISIEVGQTFRPAALRCYTREFYRRVHARLATAGICSQFLPLTLCEPAVLRSLIAAYLAVFPGATLWYNSSELLLIARRSGPLRVALPALRSALADPVLGEALDWAHWGGDAEWLRHPRVFLAGFLCGPDDLRRLVGTAPPLDDDRPWPIYQPVTVAAPQPAAQLALIAAYLSPPQALVEDCPTDLAVAARELRERHLADIAATAGRWSYRALQRAGQHRQAAELLRRSLALNPDNLRSQLLAAEALLAAGDETAAVAAYRRILAAAPLEPTANTNLGNLLQGAGHGAEAAACFERAWQADPEHADSCVNYANVCFARGLVARAAELYAQARRLDPDHAVACYGAAWIALQRGVLSDALVGYRELAVLRTAGAELLMRAAASLLDPWDAGHREILPVAERLLEAALEQDADAERVTELRAAFR